VFWDDIASAIAALLTYASMVWTYASASPDHLLLVLYVIFVFCLVNFAITGIFEPH
jgi:hypothetical protein